MAKSSTIALNIQANTQKALNQFKSFSSDLSNKFLISGLQLDVVRNALSSINREFERYAGGGGLSDAIQTQQLTRSLQASLSLVQGYSAQVGSAISENIGLALSRVNLQVGGNREDILNFTNDVSTAINQQVALGLTGTKNVVAANEQLYSLMQKLKLGYGESTASLAPKFQKVLLNQMSMEELLGSVSGGTQNLLRQAAFQSGGQIGSMSGVNRGLFFKKVQELADKFLPSTEELIKTNPQAIIGKLLNFLFDDRIGVFGTLRKIKLPTGETTTILQEGAKLLNALFGQDGLLIQFTKTIAKAFGYGDSPDAPAQGIIAFLRWLTETSKGFTDALKKGGLTGFVDKILDLLDKFVDSLPVDRLATSLYKILDKFSQILFKVLSRVPPATGQLINKTVEVIFKTIWNSITGQGGTTSGGGGPGGGGGGGQNQQAGGGGFNPLKTLLLGALGLGAVGAGVGITSFFAKRSDEKEIAFKNQFIEETRGELSLSRANRQLNQTKSSALQKEIKELERNKKRTQEQEDRLQKILQERTILEEEIAASKQTEGNAAVANAKAEQEISAIKKEAAARERRNLRLRRAGTIATGALLEGVTSASSGESLMRSLAKTGIVGAAGILGAFTGPAAEVAIPLLMTLASTQADKLVDMAGIKYNGNFPTAANGLFGAMNKESLMSGGKGLVIANQDEIIVPPHRMGQLAGMISNMGGVGSAQVMLNEKFKKYQEDQKKQMTELIREIKVGNTIKRDQAITAAPSTPVTQNTYNNKIEAKDLRDAAPEGWWESLKGGIQNLWQNIANAVTSQKAGGNIPPNFLSMYRSEMNAYGGRPVLANDKELIVSPRNYKALAYLIREVGGGSGNRPSMNNQITINVSGEADPNKIANVVMRAIDAKYKEMYESMSYV